jgi:hypothetical protein
LLIVLLSNVGGSTLVSRLCCRLKMGRRLGLDCSAPPHKFFQELAIPRPRVFRPVPMHIFAVHILARIVEFAFFTAGPHLLSAVLLYDTAELMTLAFDWLQGLGEHMVDHINLLLTYDALLALDKWCNAYTMPRWSQQFPRFKNYTKWAMQLKEKYIFVFLFPCDLH